MKSKINEEKIKYKNDTFFVVSFKKPIFKLISLGVYYAPPSMILGNF